MHCDVSYLCVLIWLIPYISAECWMLLYAVIYSRTLCSKHNESISHPCKAHHSLLDSHSLLLLSCLALSSFNLSTPLLLMKYLWYLLKQYFYIGFSHISVCINLIWSKWCHVSICISLIIMMGSNSYLFRISFPSIPCSLWQHTALSHVWIALSHSTIGSGIITS